MMRPGALQAAFPQKRRARKDEINMIYVRKVRFWDPPKKRIGFLSSSNFSCFQHVKKSGVLEVVFEKQQILIRNRCGKVTFREA
jgi:hypothetical protein